MDGRIWRPHARFACANLGLIEVLSAISHATAQTGDPLLRERYLSIVLDGLRPHDASPLPGEPVHFAEIQKARSPS